jgi:ubiquinone/menaquinone biosynthesis C-methylase UbiE
LTAYSLLRKPLGGLAVGQDGRVDETWDSIADWYAERLAAGSAPHQLAIAAMLQLLPAVTDQPVLDLGCGEGLAARALAARGAQVTGVDLSEQMIGHARRQETTSPLGIDFRVGDAQTLAGLADGAFAGVVANLSLNNVDDLDAAVHAVWRVLRPGGWLALTIPHPCFETPHASSATAPDGRAAQLVFGYFEERFWRSDNPQGFRRAGNWHRMLSTYLNTLVESGFVITRILEPEPSPALATSHPGRVDVPMFLVLRAARLP